MVSSCPAEGSCVVFCSCVAGCSDAEEDSCVMDCSDEADDSCAGDGSCSVDDSGVIMESGLLLDGVSDEEDLLFDSFAVEALFDVSEEDFSVLLVAAGLGLCVLAAAEMEPFALAAVFPLFDADAILDFSSIFFGVPSIIYKD